MSTDGRALRLPTPRVFLPLLEPARYKGLYGGRGGAKSHFFADLVIEECLLRPPMYVVCIREVQKSLEQSVKKLIETKIKKYGLEREFRISKTHIDTPGGGNIIFMGMQDHTADSIKSLEGYKRAWVEEAQSLSAHSLKILTPTMREEGSEIWFSWNPRKPTDPVDAMLRGPHPPPSSIVVRSGWEDNPFFPDVLRRDMEYARRTDPDKFQHVWQGEYETRSEARVFKNWEVDDFTAPNNAMFLFGADWGYSIDPAVLVRCYVDRIVDEFGNETIGDTLYVDHEAYDVGVEIDDLPKHFDQVPGGRDWTVIADSARPETISYMKRHGYPKMIPSIKGKDSVKEGVIFLQGLKIKVHSRCVKTIEELGSYSYKVDKLTERVTPVLEDKKNHVIDSLRYAVERLRNGVFHYREAAMTSEATW